MPFGLPRLPALPSVTAGRKDGHYRSALSDCQLPVKQAEKTGLSAHSRRGACLIGNAGGIIRPLCGLGLPAVPICLRGASVEPIMLIIGGSNPDPVRAWLPSVQTFISSIWRRERDSNPRWAFDPYALSRGAPSATRPSLLNSAGAKNTCLSYLRKGENRPFLLSFPGPASRVEYARKSLRDEQKHPSAH